MVTPKTSKHHQLDERTRFSTDGIGIMGSMDEVVASDCRKEKENCRTGYEKPGYHLASYADRFIKTNAGAVPIIKPVLGKDDLLSAFFVRCGMGRYQYTVPPGLYGIGSPDEKSDVLVTANFKLTFDILRKALDKVNAWILVLNTKGINVWCAAGKRTFSTQELVNRIGKVQLEKVVDHKRIIVPQLGATGVSAREVKRLSGFRVVYGPIRASDIQAFLNNGRRADKKMRQVTFNIYERFILTPVEIQNAIKPALIASVVLLLLSGIGPGFFSFSRVLQRGGPSLLTLAAGFFAGAFVTPVLLPFIPSRKFAFKGIVAGFLVAFFTLLGFQPAAIGLTDWVALLLFGTAVSSYLAMNFTGATPFTSPSGVEKEMKQYIPVQLVALTISCGLWIYSAF